MVDRREMGLWVLFGILTGLPDANFFSVPTIVPLRWAALRAALPRTTVSRCDGPPVTLLPILVTVSQSSAMIDFESWKLVLKVCCRYQSRFAENSSGFVCAFQSRLETMFDGVPRELIQAVNHFGLASMTLRKKYYLRRERR